MNDRRNSIRIDTVSEDRLWSRLGSMAEIGRTKNGGVNRQALTPEDGDSRALLASWAGARGYGLSIDPIGNLFVRREGSDPNADPVLTGSHLDTQPTGGRFDGAYGVLAGFEALEALDDAGVETVRPIEVVVWTNEEGCRFEPAASGSSAFVGARTLEDLVSSSDAQGIKFKAALEQTMAVTNGAERRPLGFPIHAYIENHIEQGPILEREKKTIGVVTSIQGTRWFTVDVWGRAAHAGTTPEAGRKDALWATMDILQQLREVFLDPTDLTRFTVGSLQVVSPNSINTISEHVRFTVDLRHPDNQQLEFLAQTLADVCGASEGSNDVDLSETMNMQPTEFSSAIVSRVRDTADRLGMEKMDLPSGAFHDAKYIAERFPSGMIFVPCKDGLSHNEAEDAAPADLAAGACVLTHVLAELANE